MSITPTDFKLQRSPIPTKDSLPARNGTQFWSTCDPPLHINDDHRKRDDNLANKQKTLRALFFKIMKRFIRKGFKKHNSGWGKGKSLAKTTDHETSVDKKHEIEQTVKDQPNKNRASELEYYEKHYKYQYSHSTPLNYMEYTIYEPQNITNRGCMTANCTPDCSLPYRRKLSLEQKRLLTNVILSNKHLLLKPVEDTKSLSRPPSYELGPPKYDTDTRPPSYNSEWEDEECVKERDKKSIIIKIGTETDGSMIKDDSGTERELDGHESEIVHDEVLQCTKDDIESKLCKDIDIMDIRVLTEADNLFLDFLLSETKTTQAHTENVCMCWWRGEVDILEITKHVVV
ncbi:7207_t:CDS:1 [Paraglomus occultum]|uniref:7207_t:CDS:1 n=1 Tax=Paraglomus occultum TaxID=144539 RepID=A0A9N9GH60_9GLOM|nr:7207_t:CDS:1 [Paraglomus occultum]